MNIFNKDKKPEQAVQDAEAFVKQLNEKAPLFVPYDIFKQAMEWNGENLKEIYSMIHTMNMEKPFSIEMNAGDFGFVVSGTREEADKITQSAKELSDMILQKVFSKNAMKMLVKKGDASCNDPGKSYA